MSHDKHVCSVAEIRRMIDNREPYKFFIDRTGRTTSDSPYAVEIRMYADAESAQRVMYRDPDEYDVSYLQQLRNTNIAVVEGEAVHAVRTSSEL